MQNSVEYSGFLQWNYGVELGDLRTEQRILERSCGFVFFFSQSDGVTH